MWIMGSFMLGTAIYAFDCEEIILRTAQAYPETTPLIASKRLPNYSDSPML